MTDTDRRMRGTNAWAYRPVEYEHSTLLARVPVMIARRKTGYSHGGRISAIAVCGSVMSIEVPAITPRAAMSTEGTKPPRAVHKMMPRRGVRVGR